MTAPPAYATPTEIRRVNRWVSASTLPDSPDLEEMAADVSSELDLCFLNRGVSATLIPITNPPVPAAFIRVLKMAVVFGVAAQMEGTTEFGRNADGQENIIYTTAFEKLKAELCGLTDAQLVLYGLLPPTSDTSDLLGVVGLSLVGNDQIPLPTDPEFYQYPFIFNGWHRG